MTAITLTQVKNANQLHYVSDLDAFKGVEPFKGREFAVPTGEMRFDVDGILTSQSELIIYGDDGILGSEATKKMSLIYKSSEYVDFPIQNGVFIEKFMFSEANNEEAYEDCESDGEPTYHGIIVHTLEIWLKNLAQNLSMMKIRKPYEEDSDGSTPITFILPTGDLLIMKLFKFNKVPKYNIYDGTPKFMAE